MSVTIDEVNSALTTTKNNFLAEAQELLNKNNIEFKDTLLRWTESSLAIKQSILDIDKAITDFKVETAKKFSSSNSAIVAMDTSSQMRLFNQDLQELKTKLDNIVNNATTDKEEEVNNRITSLEDKFNEIVLYKTQKIKYTRNSFTTAPKGAVIKQYNQTNTNGDVTASAVVLNGSDAENYIIVKLDEGSGDFITDYKTSINGVSPYTVKYIEAPIEIKQGGIYTKSEVDEKLASIEARLAAGNL